MTGEQLRNARKLKGWNQEQAAQSLGISQAYLSLLEKGWRRIPERLAVKVVRVFELSEAWLPVKRDQYHPEDLNEDALAEELAALGYPGLTHLGSKRKKKNPAELLLSALSKNDLDSRLVEALPWVVLKYPDMDWAWLTLAAKANDLQNRLGYVLSVGRRLAELQGEDWKAAKLGKVESSLERSLLVREDTLCHDSMTEAERKWLRKNRPAEARHWRLLTDLTPEQGVYLDIVTIVSVPEDYDQRLTEMFSGSFKNLRLLAFDPYDLALAKLERNIQRDRDDVKHLARKVPFDLDILKDRYQKELRPLLGNPQREDLTLQLWLDAIEEDRSKHEIDHQRHPVE